MSKILTTTIFKKHANLLYNNLYQYDKTIYKLAIVPVTITCPIHGDFEQLPYVHLRGNGCSKCGRDKANKKLAKSKDKFIEEATKKYNGKFDYSLVNYIQSKKLVTIICPIHGAFEQTPSCHLRGKIGCSKCANNKSKSTIQFIEQANEIHNNQFDYSESVYINRKTPILIICPYHGPFYQIPGNHLNGSTCPSCAVYYNQKNDFYFRLKSKIIHGEKYDYSKTRYDKAHKLVTITCPTHGDFEQLAYTHLNGNGCPRCVESKGERLISIWLFNKNINFKHQIKFKDCKYKRSLTFDFGIYDSEENLLGLIEYQGIQHYKPIKRFGGDHTLNDTIMKDKIKTEYCQNKNIQFLSISYTEKDKIDIILFKFIHQLTK